jgi:hypothetical protein
MITTRNTNTAMTRVYEYIVSNGITEQSRNGPVLTLPHPVTICYTHPHECVNFCPVRDANPFFHFMEMLWFIEGKGETPFICHYLPRMADYSDDGKRFNAHYGYNLRTRWFDQLETVGRILKQDPLTRRAVAQIWNPYDLLNEKTKDMSCNMQLVFRTVDGALDMTVYNRSNDAVWGGVSGANITNLWILFAYVATVAGAPTGKCYVVSNNLHVYTENPKAQDVIEEYGSCFHIVPQKDHYQLGIVEPTKYVNDPYRFSVECRAFVNRMLLSQFKPNKKDKYQEPLLADTAVPIALAHWYHKQGKPERALDAASVVRAPDWRLACLNWLERRYAG